METSLAEAVSQAHKHAEALYSAVLRVDDTTAAMCAVDRLMEALRDTTYLLVERGVQEGMTQKRMADLLGIPPSMLRGARKEFAA